MKKSIIARHFISILISFNLTSVHAEKVLPVFTNKWYGSYKDDKNGGVVPAGADNCERYNWQYPILSDKSAVLSFLHASLPYQGPCVWQPLQFDHYGDRYEDPLNYPHDFPTSLYDYEAVKKNAQIETWSARCMASDGRQLASTWVVIFPNFICPNGSRVTMQNGARFCSTTPTVCLADVVGRDLSVPGFGFLGHVGLTHFDQSENPNRVMEVLNDNTVIHLDNTLASFEHVKDATYWGERYEIDSHPNLTMHEGYSILMQGDNQKKFDPEYTLTSSWQAGSYGAALLYDAKHNSLVKNTVFTRAKFRCDTFVNYCVNSALGTAIPSSKILMPTKTFRTFVKERKDVPPQNLLNPKMASQLPRVPSTESFIPKVDKNILAIDTLVQNQKLTQIEKMHMLLNQLKSTHNTVQYGYIADTLAGLSNASILPQLTNLYLKENNDENKMRLLATVVASVKIKQTTNMLTSLDKENLIKAQAFIKQVLATEVKPQALHQAIDQVFSLLPMDKEIYTLITDAITRLQHIDKSNLSIEHQWILNWSMAFANKEMQHWLLPQLFNKKLTDKENEIRKETLSFILKQLAAENIDDSMKDKIKLFLHQHLKPTVEYYGALDYAKSNTSLDNQKQVITQILAEENIEENCRNLNQLTLKTLAVLTEEQRNQILTKIHQHFYSDNKRRVPTVCLLTLSRINSLFAADKQ